MKNDQNDPNLQENDQNNQTTPQNQSSSPDTSSSPSKITLSLPNPQIYLSKAKNHIKNTTFIRKFLQKTLKSQVIFIFLLILRDQLPQHIGKNTSMAIVLYFHRSIYSAKDRDFRRGAVLASDADRDILARFNFSVQS